MTYVGVTGHRRLKVSDGLVQAIDTALLRIASVFPGPLTLVSPLAEGADQLVVRRAFSLGHQRLTVPLPLPKDDYIRTFMSTDAQAEFQRLLAQASEIIALDSSGGELEAYRAAGRWLLDHSDVLVAVWDGRPPRGDAGTGEIVGTARARGLPIAWIHTEQSPTWKNRVATSDVLNGRVEYERL